MAVAGNQVRQKKRRVSITRQTMTASLVGYIMGNGIRHRFKRDALGRIEEIMAAVSSGTIATVVQNK